MGPFELAETKFGFEWGPVKVERLMDFDRGLVLSLETFAGRRLQIFVSPKGKSLQIHEDGIPWEKKG